MSIGDDHSIFPSMEYVKPGPRWKIDLYDELGVFDAKQLEVVIDRFGFSEGDARALSICLGNCLDSSSSINLTEVSRDRALERGRKKLNKALSHLKKSQGDRAMLVSVLDEIDGIFVLKEVDGFLVHCSEELSQLEEARALSMDIDVPCEELHEAIDALAKTNAVAILAPKDARKYRDRRRYQVIKNCCIWWKETGRKLTVTTSATKQRDIRGGPLIEFIRWVGLELTDPPNLLPGETLKEDIERVRADLEREANQMDLMPEFEMSYYRPNCAHPSVF
ncbi:hypothetical protein [Litorisediminicola beolgyonensis]|uniref:Uncharacterized protein n=1 Tax=Litorisediminicola beolgyonensis TaxID=1173614 RepID=A0ABW3ZP71_9RHOB